MRITAQKLNNIISASPEPYLDSQTYGAPPYVLVNPLYSIAAPRPVIKPLGKGVIDS